MALYLLSRTVFNRLPIPSGTSICNESIKPSNTVLFTKFLNRFLSVCREAAVDLDCNDSRPKGLRDTQGYSAVHSSSHNLSHEQLPQ